MKSIGPWLAIGLTVVIAAIVAIYSFLPQQPAAAQEVLATSANTAAAPATAFNERESVYQEQIALLEQSLQDRQETYQAQIQELTKRVTLGYQQLAQLEQQEQTLLQQINQLKSVRAERALVYQNQLQQATIQYETRNAELQAQLDEARAKLAEANAQLGR